ncbi:MFS general substrate transporter [Hypomontagnella monticulosa]|nr:MFS general substrate transporter [Hypomontagnella monticulosa]
MVMNIYWIALLVLVPLVALASGHEIILKPFRAAETEKVATARDEEANKFRKIFLRVYLLVMGSEWLQGPYMYSLFRDEKALDQQTVASLYIATYISAAVSAFLTGYLADKLGRRAACLVFCGVHSLASISVKFDAIEILIAGRALGGIGLNLLWTVFESWMVTEYNTRALDESSFPLSSMFGVMTKYNCMTAILAGIIGYCIVLVSGSKADPFLIGVVLDVGAAILMIQTWNENKGARGSPHPDDGVTNTTPTGGITIALKDPDIWILSFASCYFEGTMFIFTFFWPGVLQEAHDAEYPEHADGTPYGVIFATFMAAMVLGAMFFGFCTRNANLTGAEQVGTILSVISPTLILATALFLSSLSFVIAVVARAEIHLFLAFLLLEFCNGLYVPSMAYHRSMLVGDSNRAFVYGLMNIPLFGFVVIALYASSENEFEHRQAVFSSSAVLLLVAAVSIVLGLGIPSLRPGFQRVRDKDVNDVAYG